MKSPDSADVVVCGAGPVGLTAAALLAARGVEVVVVERNRSTSDEPKAISIDDESLRVYQRAGIVDDVLPVVVPGTGTRYYDRHGMPLFHARGPRPFRLGYPFKNPFAQPDLERVLVDALSAMPNVTVHFATEVTGFDQHADSVSVYAVSEDRPVVFEAAYVLGCDGGRSVTRLGQGVEMTGRSYSDLPEDVAYAVAWILGETRHLIESQYLHLAPERSPITYPLDPPTMGISPVPLHAGAASYYRALPAAGLVP
ncbi:FAD-dependent oxidoreductase [Nocardia salmonicida]|uniref:FAD-dependent oxidoreductase n=1 Tax=Nocardia salmonicida TaxID=53431 RepID=UPI0036A1C482